MTKYGCLRYGLLLIFFGQLCFGAKQLSLTSDEPAHIANGYAILTTGDFWSVPLHGHPPLINSWTVWPLLLQPERPDVTTIPGWQENLIIFIDGLWDKFGSLDRLAYVTRYPNMLLALLLMALVYRWAREWLSPTAGCLAIAIMMWDPTMIAHAQLNTTDLGLTLFAFTAFYFSWRLWHHFSFTTLLGIGLACGAAMAAKASGILVSLLVGVVFGGYYLLETYPQWRVILSRAPERKTSLRQLYVAGAKWLRYSFVVLASAMFVLWASYGFTLRPYPLAAHVDMLRIFFAEKDRLAFANGQLRVGGWWWYFPFAFVIKTPIPAIIAYFTGLVQTLKDVRSLLQRDLALWVFPLCYLATALFGGINIGYRHLLPIFPFIYVNTSRISVSLFRRTGRIHSGIKLLIAAVLGVWYIWGTVRVYPFSLAYFNEFVGGAKNGYHYLVDSNVEWGQSFKALKNYVELHHITEIWCSYYTWVDPGAYGISYHPLFPARGSEAYFPRRYDPEPGFYVISATTLQGIALKEHDPDLYEWFRHRKPQAQPGYGLLVYEVKPHVPSAEWIAQCSTPVISLSSTAIYEGLGRTNLRHVAFDCTQSWIYPNAGQNSGWYTLFHETWSTASQFTQAHLASSRLSYEQTSFNVVPAFTLFEWSGGTSPLWDNSVMTVLAAPVSWPPAQVDVAGEIYTTPVGLGDTLAFLGYRVTQLPQENAIELWTAWRVQAIPTRPLSLMGHLLGPDARPIIVSDGLGISPDQWQIGDLIVQRHRFALPQDMPADTYWLQTGAYWLDTLERLPIQNSTLQADRLLLTAIEVKP